MGPRTKFNTPVSKGDIRRSVCAKESRRYEVGQESRGPAAECVYADLVLKGYSAASLRNGDGEASHTLCYLCDFVYGAGKIQNKADAKSLNLAHIIPCKFIVARDLPIYSNPDDIWECFAPNQVYRKVSDYGKFGSE